MCDHFFDLCADPCGSCRTQCGREVDYVSVLTCTQRCNEICGTVDSEGDPPTLACQAELSRCRSTSRNAVCVDHVSDRRVNGDNGPVCSAAIGRANCACGNDAACLRVLDELNPPCRKCNNDWKEVCIAAVCQTEADAYAACLKANPCTGEGECTACKEDEDTLTHCLRWSATDPRDIGGGCRTRARMCWDDPFCPDGVLK